MNTRLNREFRTETCTRLVDRVDVAIFNLVRNGSPSLVVEDIVILTVFFVAVARHHFRQPFGNALTDTVTNFSCCIGRECNCQNLRRIRAAFQKFNVPVCQCRSFPRPCASCDSDVII